PVLRRFADDLQLSGKSRRTQQSYCRALRKFTEYLGHSPDQATEEQLRDYLLYVTEHKTWQPSTINVAQQALKQFFRITCPRQWNTLKLARVRVEQKLPVVISVGEVHTLLKLIEKPSMHCYFHTVYSMGLRLQEALQLQVSDIDSQRKMVHIHRGKGAKDRLVPLPDSTLQLMRDYWKTHRNPVWMFPAEGRNHRLAPTADRPMSESSVQDVIKAVLAQLNWDNRGIPTHTLRHCYATHLLEAGVSLKLIQKYLGHKHLTSTMIYLHVTTVGEEAAIAKINAIMKRKS
ncbi:MAG: site-specific integrase, partial [Planctomycetales bacterium]|nr:site-specific integrase [Planctomycetales bacterium]